MALSVNDFLTAAMLHPGAEAFSISKSEDEPSGISNNESSKQDAIQPFSGVFHDTKISPESIDKSKKALAVLKNALEEKFGKRATRYAWPLARYSLTAHEMTQVIKMAESTASKHAILREGKHVLSKKFIFSSDYIASLRTFAETEEPSYVSSCRTIAEELDNYENEVESLKPSLKQERLDHLKSKVEALLNLQINSSSNDHPRELVMNSHKELLEATQLLLEGITSEIALLKEEHSEKR